MREEGRGKRELSGSFSFSLGPEGFTDAGKAWLKREIAAHEAWLRSPRVRLMIAFYHFKKIVSKAFDLVLRAICRVLSGGMKS